MIEWILKIFTRQSNLENLIAKAEKWHKESGKQYFIMPTRKINDPNYDKTLIIVNGKTFMDNYNKKAKLLKQRKMTYIDMVNQCVYKTSPGTTLKR